MSLTVPAFDLLPAIALPIAGTEDIFPVGRIFCVGRNYADHVVEMGGDPDREEPFFITKPANALTQDDVVPYPRRKRKTCTTKWNLWLPSDRVLLVAAAIFRCARRLAMSSATRQALISPAVICRQKQRGAVALGTWPRASISPAPVLI